MRANVFIDLEQNRIKVTPIVSYIKNKYGDVFFNNPCIEKCYLDTEKDYANDKIYREFYISCDNKWHKFVNRLNSSIDIVAFLKTFNVLNIVVINSRGCIICGEN